MSSPYRRSLVVELPPDQHGDPVRTAVEVRYRVDVLQTSETGLGRAGWELARGHQLADVPNSLLNDLIDVEYGAGGVLDRTVYAGVPMWQFVHRLAWRWLYFATELVDALLSAIEGHAIDEIVVRPTGSPVGAFWLAVVRATGRSRALPVRSEPQHQNQTRYSRDVETVLRDSALRPLLREGRALARRTRMRQIERRLPGRRRQPATGRTLLFASYARHWTADPSGPDRRYDEQYYPLLQALREEGWTRFVGIDLPDPEDRAAFLDRVETAPADLEWRGFESYAAWPSRMGDHSRSFFDHSWASLRSDKNLAEAATHRGVVLAPVLFDALQDAFRWGLPASVQAIDTAGRVLKRERPEVVLLTYEYGPYGIALQVAADRADIPVLALQHGLISDRHWGYMMRPVTTHPTRSPAAFAIPTKTLVWGQAWARILTESGGYPESAVDVTGNWRYDAVLSRRDQIRSDFRRELGIEESATVALILASGFDLTAYLRACLAAVIQTHGVVPLVKLHPNLSPGPARTVLAEMGLPEHVLVPNRMAAAILAGDLVITQVSTAISEAMLLDRPVVVVDTEGGQDGAQRDPARDGYLVVTDLSELKSAIGSALDDGLLRSDLASGRRGATADWFYRDDGLSASRVASSVSKVVDEAKPVGREGPPTCA